MTIHILGVCMHVFVCVSGAAPANCTEGEVRLEGCLNNMGGRVEICHKGVWGTVCAHEWGEPEARVVCNQLGFTECKQHTVECITERLPLP